MDPVSAAASIVAVAEVGARLSLSLYKVVDCYRSSAKEIRSIAKNVALFAAVLKDLGHALERGEQQGHYRPEVYENCAALTTVCETVFAEIRQGLKVESLEGKAWGELEKATKLMWMVNKPKVELWESRLESLKANVAVQRTVLSMAEQADAADHQESVSEDMPALKSVILADETARKEYEALLTKDRENRAKDPVYDSLDGPGALLRVPDDASSHRQSNGSTISQDGTARSSLGTVSSPGIASQLLRSSPSQRDSKTSSRQPGVKVFGASKEYKSLWAQADILEHAIRKVDLAQWELDRFEDNKSVRLTAKQRSDPVQNEALQRRLIRRLTSLGMDPVAAGRVVFNLIEEASPGIDGRRRLMKMEPGGELPSLPPYVKSATKHTSELLEGKSQWRLMPDMLDDLLWSHMCKTLDIIPVDNSELKEKLTTMTQAVAQPEQEPLVPIRPKFINRPESRNESRLENRPDTRAESRAEIPRPYTPSRPLPILYQQYSQEYDAYGQPLRGRSRSRSPTVSHSTESGSIRPVKASENRPPEQNTPLIPGRVTPDLTSAVQNKIRRRPGEPCERCEEMELTCNGKFPVCVACEEIGMAASCSLKTKPPVLLEETYSEDEWKEEDDLDEEDEDFGEDYYDEEESHGDDHASTQQSPQIKVEGSPVKADDDEDDYKDDHDDDTHTIGTVSRPHSSGTATVATVHKKPSLRIFKVLNYDFPAVPEHTPASPRLPPEPKTPSTINPNASTHSFNPSASTHSLNPNASTNSLNPNASTHSLSNSEQQKRSSALSQRMSRTFPRLRRSASERYSFNNGNKWPQGSTSTTSSTTSSGLPPPPPALEIESDTEEYHRSGPRRSRSPAGSSVSSITTPNPNPNQQVPYLPHNSSHPSPSQPELRRPSSSASIRSSEAGRRLSSFGTRKLHSSAVRRKPFFPEPATDSPSYNKPLPPITPKLDNVAEDWAGFRARELMQKYKKGAGQGMREGRGVGEMEPVE